MSTFIFCLIFIQVSIFLIAGVILVATFHIGVSQHDSEELADAQPELEGKPAAPEPERPLALGNAILTRSELNYLLGI